MKYTLSTNDVTWSKILLALDLRVGNGGGLELSLG